MMLNTKKFSKIATTAVVCTSLLAGQMAFASAPAEARDGRGERGAYGHNTPGPRHYAPTRRHDNYAPQRRRDNKGKKIITGVAIGIGALILGSILANEARRR